VAIILATQEAERSGLQFEASTGKQFARPYLRKAHYNKGAGGVAEGVGPEFKSQYCKKKKKTKNWNRHFSVVNK
jgi:hypothetical protein